MKRYGIIATVIYGLGLAAWVYLDWTRFYMLEPNEWGDFLAGTVGPVALLWVVLSFWLQSDELKNSVNALKLQADELKKSVEAQTQLVSVTNQQLELDIKEKEESQARQFALEAREKQERLDERTPEFLVSFSGGSSGSGGQSTKYVVTNCKGHASEVQITVIAPDDEIISVTPSTKRGIPKGDSFQLGIASTKPLASISDLTMYVNSWGTDRSRREQVFCWSSNEVDQMESNAFEPNED